MNQASTVFDDDIVRPAQRPHRATFVTPQADGQPPARYRQTDRLKPPLEAQLAGRSADARCAGAGDADRALPP